ncbi:TPA: phage tail protein [Klebsiella pneumoniae]|uniref:phage tail protein n=1 Tax=Klebsiella pneumoniae TaxID=573 RepID=UPI002731E292|nr:phage tail protein [Klebsiella pneumoniae]MDP0695176.1 phage tail protein [Klebsiella pneumoniae]
MSTKFYTLLTDIGAAKLASAAALGVPLKITHMAVGDGGGTLPTPDAKQTALVNEKRRAALNMLYIDQQNSSQIIAEQVIPENEGGWWIREVGLFDESGALIAVGNCPESYKPQLAEGSGRTQTVRMVLITSSTDNITLKIDPAVVLATRKYVDDKVLELKVYVDDLMAKHTAASDPHTQYAPKASPTFTGTPKAPTAAAGNNSTQLATTAFVQAAIAALVDSSPGALDTLNELAKALGNDPNFATTMTNALAGKMDKSANGEDIPDKDIFLQNAGVGTAGKRNVGSGSGQIPDMSFFQSTKGSNGIQYLPGGIIIQWGIWQLTAVGNYNAETIGGITWYTHYTKPLYTIAFPNMALVNYVGLAGSVFEGQINEYNTFVRSNMSAGSDGKAGSRTNACVSVTSRILGYTPTVHWLAIGY